jgi:hypothetical protein
MGVTAGSGYYSNVVDLYNGASGTTILPTTPSITSPVTAAAGSSTSALAPPTTSSETGVDVGVAVGASVGSVTCVVLLVAAVWRWRKYLSQVYSCSTLVPVFFPLQMMFFEGAGTTGPCSRIRQED